MPASAEVTRTEGPKTAEGEKIEVFTIKNSKGLQARVISWGASLIEMLVPDRDGKIADVTLGFDQIDAYLKPHPFFGSIAGRYANRIAKGRFTLDGETFTLAVNHGPNHLHGGKRGFDKRNWKAAVAGPHAVRFEYVSPDGEEGYPGTMQVAVTYTLTEDQALRIDYTATTDKPTVVNLTNHTYWNLAGEGDVLSHLLRIHADHYLAVDEGLIPTGEIKPVEGSPLDFRSMKPVGRDIEPLLGTPAGGYDHNFVINSRPGAGIALAAELHDPASGRLMTVETDQPGVQFYSANHFRGMAGKKGQSYAKHAGLCLETQHFPDAPNRPEFPSTVLRPGETFRSTTVHTFAIR